jgi:hypothetical protein
VTNFSNSCIAQKNDAAIIGIVSDVSGAPIPFALIKSYSNNELSGTAKSDMTGNFKITNLWEHSRHDLKIEVNSYQTKILNSVIANRSSSFYSIQLLKSNENLHKTVKKFSCLRFSSKCKICGQENTGSVNSKNNELEYFGFNEWCPHYRSKLCADLNKKSLTKKITLK